MSIIHILIAYMAILSTEATIKSCSSANSKFEFYAVSLKPDPPIRGQPVTLSVDFTNPGDTIQSGTIETSISLNYIPLPTQTTPLCEYTECPLVSGTQTRISKMTWPDTVRGRIVSKLVWKDVSDNELLCIQLLTYVS
jgi:hypothetical protein